ncbi:unnamed protein product [Clavelina lepadiformis]|uniref:Dolichyldiphosphatase 1 n=1 Tax=Clavelina lepadiformis TaxID=159417 RepID=A0ABP0F7G2_CLALP
MSANNSLDQTDWKTVGFTHVEYPKGDFIGFILAWSSLFPFFVLSGFVTHIYFRREIHTISFFAGIFLNEGVNLVLKYIVREPRPTSPHTVSNLEYGWPSSHSQFTWFFVTYIIFFIYFRSHSSNSMIELIWKHSMTAVCILTACVVAFSRYYLQYHNFNQVLWGSFFGVVLGTGWFVFTHVILSPFFQTVVTLEICEFLMIRDSTLIPNIMWFEYTTSRQESRTRRKMVSKKVQ